MVQSPITSFFASVEAATRQTARASTSTQTEFKGLALFDPYRSCLRTWKARGENHPVDYITDDSILSDQLKMNRLVETYKGTVELVLAFPPCTDLCVAGARWWKRKREERPTFQEDAKAELKRLKRALDQIGAPYAIVLPCSAPIKRALPFAFLTSPNEFGGWLNANVDHPLFPLFVPQQDAYSKRTLIACGNGMRLPRRKPVEPIWVEKILKTGKVKKFSPLMAHRKKRDARRCPPLALCAAFVENF